MDSLKRPYPKYISNQAQYWVNCFFICFQHPVTSMTRRTTGSIPPYIICLKISLTLLFTVYCRRVYTVTFSSSDPCVKNEDASLGLNLSKYSRDSSICILVLAATFDSEGCSPFGPFLFRRRTQTLQGSGTRCSKFKGEIVLLKQQFWSITQIWHHK